MVQSLNLLSNDYAKEFTQIYLWMEFTNSLGVFKLVDLSNFIGTNLAINISNFPLSFTTFELLNNYIVNSIKRKSFHSLLTLGKTLIPKILHRCKKYPESQDYGITLL